MNIGRILPGIPTIISDLLAAAILAVLIAAGLSLANWAAPEEIAIHYSSKSNHVDFLTTWHILLRNPTKIAFDMEIKIPVESVMHVAFSPPPSHSNSWKGQLIAGSSVEVLAVFQGSDVELSSSTMSKAVKATYQGRDETTGVLQPRLVALREASGLSLPRTLLWIIGFLVPFIFLTLIVLVLWRWPPWKRGSPTEGVRN
jgi:hypothetical protein